MADNALTRRRWIGRLTFAGLGLLILFVQLIPLETVPPSLGGSTLLPIEQRATTSGDNVELVVFYDAVRWIAPNFLLLFAVTWVTRRPSFAPVLVLAALFFLADMLFQRPPGLWTALVLILTEMLRNRSRSMRTLPFWLEWVTVSLGIIAITAVYRFTLSIFLVPQASLGLTFVHLMLTLATYPAVVFVSYAVFGVSRPAPGQVDTFGHRI